MVVYGSPLGAANAFASRSPRSSAMWRRYASPLNSYAASKPPRHLRHANDTVGGGGEHDRIDVL